MAIERRLSFGGVAELYDETRPSYPEELVDDVLAFADADLAAHVLEVGAGTGKATQLFARRGLSVVALEPSPEMAAVARRNCTRFNNVRIIETDFEHWHPDGRPFELLCSAQAWHWVSRETKYARARAALRDGGALALFWSRPRWEACELREQVHDAYRRSVPEFIATPGPMYPDTGALPEMWGNMRAELDSAEGFEQRQTRSYGWDSYYSADEYTRLLGTHSDHIVLDPGRCEALLASVAQAIDANGGTLHLEYVTVLYLARAATTR